MFTPLKNRIVIARDKAEEHTKSGLTIPLDAQEVKTTGIVIAVGKEVQDVSVGDSVLFGKHDGVILDPNYFDNKGEFVLMSEEMVRGIISHG